MREERRNAVDYVGLIERAATKSAGNRSRPPTLIVTNDGCGALCAAAAAAAVERGIAWKACKHARSTQQKGNQHERKCGMEYKRQRATCNQTANLQSTVSTKRTAITARGICGCRGGSEEEEKRGREHEFPDGGGGGGAVITRCSAAGRLHKALPSSCARMGPWA